MNHAVPQHGSSSVSRPGRPAGRGPFLWLLTGSMVAHVVGLSALRPWVRSRMGYDPAEEEQRTAAVRRHEIDRKALDRERRARTHIPVEHRNRLKTQAERKECDVMRRRIQHMARDRDDAVKRRRQALQRLRERDKLDVVRRKVTPCVTRCEAIKKLGEQKRHFTAEQANKTEAQRHDDAAVKQIAASIAAAAEELVKEPEKARDHLDTIRHGASKLRTMMHALKREDEGKERYYHSRLLLNTAYAIHRDLDKARAHMREVDALHTTPAPVDGAVTPASYMAEGSKSGVSDAQKSGASADAPYERGHDSTQEQQKTRPGSGGDKDERANTKSGGAMRDPGVSETDSSGQSQHAASIPPRRSSSGNASDPSPGQDRKAAGQGSRPTRGNPAKFLAGSDSGETGASPSQLYQRAKALEVQVAAVVNDARAAELANLHDLSFATARKRMRSYTPSRPELDSRLKGNTPQTIGDLSDYREAVRQAGAQVESMALRTASMAGALQRADKTDRNDVNRQRMLGRAAGGRGLSHDSGTARREGLGADAAPGGEHGDGDGEAGTVGGGGSHGLRKGGGRIPRDSIVGGKLGTEIKLPQDLIKAEALPGRMITDRATRKGWLYIDTWYVIGPWPISESDMFAAIYPPEYEIDFDATYTNGKFRKDPGHESHEMRWLFVQSDEIRVSPPHVYGDETWYAYTEIHSDRSREMLIAVASDDSAKVWFNGDVVWEDRHESPWRMGEAFRRITVLEGYNSILIRIGNGPEYCIWSVLLCPPEVVDRANLSGAET